MTSIRTETYISDKHTKFEAAVAGYMKLLLYREDNKLEPYYHYVPALPLHLAAGRNLVQWYDQSFHEGRQFINQLIQGVGISHYFRDTATGSEIPCRYTYWHGLDPGDPSLLVWDISAEHAGRLSVDRSMLDELQAPNRFV